MNKYFIEARFYKEKNKADEMPYNAFKELKNCTVKAIDHRKVIDGKAIEVISEYRSTGGKAEIKQSRAPLHDGAVVYELGSSVHITLIPIKEEL